MKRAAALMVGAGLLVACVEVFEQPYKQPPNVSTVMLTVVWTEKAEIERQCDNVHAYACATVATPERPYSTIWAMKPRSFSHPPYVEALGHELLHALGATHD